MYNWTRQTKQGARISIHGLNPRPGQYLKHTHSHITQAVAAMGSCWDFRAWLPSEVYL